MHPFRYARPADLAAAMMAAKDPTAECLAGGTDMLQLLKDDIRRPAHLLDLGGIAELQHIEAGPSGLRLGALARMSDVAEHPVVKAEYPVLSQALLASASPQVRNMGTMGGNLLQRTRCLYFRDIATPCNRRIPGSGCGALNGENRLHAILGGSDRCVATHPSDLAVALVALDAVLVAQSLSGERRIPVEAFHLVPGETPDRETALAPGEIITAVEVPATAFAQRSLYYKVRDRASFEFALAAAAVALDLGEGGVREARVALGGVATKPWRAHSVEAALRGAPLERAAFETAASHAADGAQVLAQNGFKVPLVQRAVLHALVTLGI